MKFYQLLLLSLFSCTALFGQNQDSLDVIYLKNGMIMEGLVTNFKEDRSLKLALLGGVKMGLRLADIDSIKWVNALSNSQMMNTRQAIKVSRIQLQMEEGELSIPITETVYLKNGQIVEGKIISYSKGERLRMYDQAGHEFVFEDADIRRIVQDVDRPTLKKYLRQRRRMLRPFNYAFRETGTYYEVSLSTFTSDTGLDESDQTAVGIHFAVGKQWNRYWGTGIGIGFDGYDSFGSGTTLLPLYVQARGYLQKKWQSPFYSLNAGYAFALGGDTEAYQIEAEGGWMIHPAVGWRFGASAKSNFTIDLGVKYQKAYIERISNFNGDLEIRDILYRRLTLRFGLVF
ncbi:MAG: hypothetical protein KTR30_35695 [Saprospiraceae bacterium]|nr:hypothetical protein [Saprospiraceae bacterium]